MASSPNLDALVETFAAAVAEAVKTQVEQALIEALSNQLPAGRRPKRQTVAAPSKRKRRAAPAAPKRAARPKSAGRRKRRSSAELEQVQSDVLALVARQPGYRAESMGRELELPSQALSPVLRALVEEGALRKEGAARGTRYFLAGTPAATQKASAAKPATASRSNKKATKRQRAKNKASVPTAEKTPVAAADGPREPERTESEPTPAARPVRTRLRAPRRDAGKPTTASTQPSDIYPGSEAPAPPEPSAEAATAEATPRDLHGEALRWVQSNPGDTTAIISQALEASTAEIRGVLQALIANGQIVREGEGQGATFSAQYSR